MNHLLVPSICSTLYRTYRYIIVIRRLVYLLSPRRLVLSLLRSPPVEESISFRVVVKSEQTYVFKWGTFGCLLHFTTKYQFVQNLSQEHQQGVSRLKFPG